MTVWDDQLEGHRVFLALEQAGQALTDSEEHLADVAQTEAHARLRRVVDATREVIDAVDAELVSFPALETIAGHLDTLSAHVQQFTNSPQQSYLDNANGQADGVLVQLPALLPPRTTEDVEGLQGAVSSFRRSIGQHARNVDSELNAARRKTEELDKRMKEQEARLDSQDTRIDNVPAQFQSQFSTEQSQRQAQFSEALERSRTQAPESRAGTASKPV